MHQLKAIEEFEVNVVLQVKLDPQVHMVRKELRGDIGPSGRAGVEGDRWWCWTAWTERRKRCSRSTRGKGNVGLG